MPRKLQLLPLTPALLRLSGSLSIVPGSSWVHIRWVWRVRQQHGQLGNKKAIEHVHIQPWCTLRGCFPSQNFQKILAKNLATQKCCRKNTKVVFLDYFSPPESESEIFFCPKVLNHKIINWWSLLVHNCSNSPVYTNYYYYVVIIFLSLFLSLSFTL